MDVERIAELRAWAARLEARTDTDELRAAGRAIAMLVGEVEDIQARLVVAATATPTAARHALDEPLPATAVPYDRTAGSFFDRLKRTLGFQ